MHTTAYLLLDPEGDPYDGTTDSYEVPLQDEKAAVGKKITKTKKAKAKAKGKCRKLYADSDDSSGDESKPTRKVPPTTSRLPKKSPPPARSSNSESDEEESATEPGSRAGKLG